MFVDRLIGLFGATGRFDAKPVHGVFSTIKCIAEALTEFIKFVASFTGGAAQRLFGLMEEVLQIIGGAGFSFL